jgi:hypothetical protein
MRAKRKMMVVLMVIMALVLVTAVAYAITIAVDGVQEGAWTGGGSVGDGDEVAITNNGVDIQTVRWTNDTSNFYFLFETYGNTTWNLPGFTEADLILCINSDNVLGTGSSLPGQCLGSGYDVYVRLVGPTPTVSVFDSTFTPVAATTQVGFVGTTITEISVDLASLGLSTANCGVMPVGIYFDGQTADPDDNVTDVGDISMTCGEPTAVTLQNVSASGSSVLPFALGAFGLIVVSTGLVISRKRKGVQ